jgi:hypothetical protein
MKEALDEFAADARGGDPAEVRLFWQAVARKATHQEIISNVILICIFTIASLAMLTGVVTWIRWLL